VTLEQVAEEVAAAGWGGSAPRVCSCARAKVAGTSVRTELDLFLLPLGLDTFAIAAALRLHSAKQVAIDVLRPARKPLHSLALARQTG
jgi:hypothetical protein